MCVIILNVPYCYKQVFSSRLSPAVMISHPMPCIDPLLLALQPPSIGYKGGNPITGKERTDIFGRLTIKNYSIISCRVLYHSPLYPKAIGGISKERKKKKNLYHSPPRSGRGVSSYGTPHLHQKQALSEQIEAHARQERS